MAEGLRSNSESERRQSAGQPTVDTALGERGTRSRAADSRAGSPSIRDPLGDYSEQTGAFFG